MVKFLTHSLAPYSMCLVFDLINSVVLSSAHNQIGSGEVGIVDHPSIYWSISTSTTMGKWQLKSSPQWSPPMAIKTSFSTNQSQKTSRDIRSHRKSSWHDPNPSSIFNHGERFLAHFKLDLFSAYQHNNLYYPFALLNDWEMANFLLKSRLSMNLIDKVLLLQMVSWPWSSRFVLIILSGKANATLVPDSEGFACMGRTSAIRFTVEI